MQEIKEMLPRILGTLEPVNQQATPSKQPNELKRRRWLDKWIGLRADHQQLKNLEISVSAFCMDYAKNPTRGRRLIIYGPNGTGKSHVARAVHRWAGRIAMDIPLQAGDEGPRLSESLFVHWPSFIKRLKAGEWSEFSRLLEPEMLALDDVGAEHDPSGMAQEHLYLVLERREFRWTIITTNFAPEEWASRFEQRIISRLLRNSEMISLKSVPDYNAHP